MISRSKSLVVRDLDFAVPVRRNAADILALFRRCLSAPDKPAVGRGKFAPRHEESELEVFFVELVLRVERLERRNYLGAAVLECLGDKPLIHGITTARRSISMTSTPSHSPAPTSERSRCI